MNSRLNRITESRWAEVSAPACGSARVVYTLDASLAATGQPSSVRSAMSIESPFLARRVQLHRSGMRLTSKPCRQFVESSITFMPLLRSWAGRGTCVAIDMALLTELFASPPLQLDKAPPVLRPVKDAGSVQKGLAPPKTLRSFEQPMETRNRAPEGRQ